MNAKHEQLHDVLSAFWDQNVLEVPADEGDVDEEIAIDQPLVQLDSITAVDVLLDIEKIVGKHLPIEKIVRKGGYSSREQFIQEVTNAVDECLGASP
jgi:acyl carrier protein